MNGPTTNNLPRRPYRPLEVFGLTCSGHDVEVPTRDVKNGRVICPHPQCGVELRIEWSAERP